MVMFNVKGRVIHTGKRGGTYVVDEKGRKVYKFTPAAAAPMSPNKTGFTKTHYETPTSKCPIYTKNASGRFFVYMKTNKKPFHAFSMEKHVRNVRTGEVKSLHDHVKGPRAPPKKPAAKPPPREVVNYDALFMRNKAPPTHAKVRRYAMLWLAKNIPADASYKRIALIVHPDKGNRTNSVNQAKRTTLFKYLSR